MNYTLKQVDGIVSPENKTKVITLPRNARIILTGNVSGEYTEIEYYNKKCYIPTKVIERNDWEQEIVTIPESMKQKNINIPSQYIRIDGNVKYNMCGEFCTAYISGKSIDAVIENWKRISPNHYNIAVTKDKPIGIEMVESILKSNNLSYERWSSVFSDARYGQLLSPKILGKRLGKISAIVGVKIDGTGAINSNGSIGHWVALDNCIQMQGCNYGIVEIYNPYWNRFETYSYTEFMNSANRFGSLVGTFVSRNI